MTNNSHVLEWIEEMKALVKPDKVVWVTGGEEQIKALRAEAIATGLMEELNPEKLPGCLLHRTKPNDVARVGARTFFILLPSILRLALDAVAIIINAELQKRNRLTH